MKILALELSSARGSIAVREGEKERAFHEFPNDRKHSGAFFETLQRFLELHGNPERIVVGLGPGSYAGTRIAIAAAIGLQMATGAELVGIPSFCTLPAEAREYAVVGDARRQLFSFVRVVDRRAVEDPILYPASELAQRLDGISCPVFSAESLADFPTIAPMFPSAALLAMLGTSEKPSTVPMEPIYLREPYITRPNVSAI